MKIEDSLKPYQIGLLEMIKEQLKGHKPLKDLPVYCGELRPSKSTALYIQKLGRAERITPPIIVMDEYHWTREKK